MNTARADSTAAELVGGGPAAPELQSGGGPTAPACLGVVPQCGTKTEAPPEERGAGSWSLRRWLTLIALVFAAQLALIFAFGEYKPIVPRAVKNVPALKLTASSGEWLALNDPTLFALPNRKGFAGPAWLEPPPVEFHRMEWTEPPRWLPLPVGELGATFSQFMQTNRFTTFQFELKTPPRFTVPVVPVEPVLAKTSTLRIEGGMARRRLLTPMKLPSWPYADVLAPSKVQVLVNAAGNVISTVLLPSDNPMETAGHYDAADQRALELARAARFAPSSDLTIGRLVFDWHTVAPAATNAPPNP